MMSGSGNADTIITKQDEAIRRNTDFLNSLNCKGSSVELVECARKINHSDLLEKSNEFKNKLSEKLSEKFFKPSNPLFTAVVDYYFLTDTPRNLLKNGNFKQCSIITGVNDY